ncbi:MAG: hypothetical protein H0T73_09210 [Ardenticatenales bacterium]|nr:hypothetical protein [Ardenticatenales bacterium]
MTLNEILPAARKLPAADKLRLIRLLVEELESRVDVFSLEEDRTYDLQTPYDSYGAAEILMNALHAAEDAGNPRKGSDAD